MSIAISLIIVYTMSAVCIRLMKEIQPENKIYPAWTVFICVTLTIFVVACVLME